ncbi:MAG: hypothetical protein UV34_C0032G0007 [Parcubacteria group bacterium GW2011_GWB1_42_6]|nr:MAG: hypothetical protein UV34_C0032G0007 [Parcubacteria group bacterium GW2011_GWB1_42_6]
MRVFFDLRIIHESSESKIYHIFKRDMDMEFAPQKGLWFDLFSNDRSEFKAQVQHVSISLQKKYMAKAGNSPIARVFFETINWDKQEKERTELGVSPSFSFEELLKGLRDEGWEKISQEKIE